MADKLMYIVHFQWWYTKLFLQWFRIYDTELNEPTYQNSIKVPKVIRPMNHKIFNLKLWGLVKKTAKCPHPPCCLLVSVCTSGNVLDCLDRNVLCNTEYNSLLISTYFSEGGDN